MRFHIGLETRENPRANLRATACAMIIIIPHLSSYLVCVRYGNYDQVDVVSNYGVNSIEVIINKTSFHASKTSDSLQVQRKEGKIETQPKER